MDLRKNIVVHFVVNIHRHINMFIYIPILFILFMVENIRQASFYKIQRVFTGYVTSNKTSKGRCRLGVV